MEIRKYYLFFLLLIGIAIFLYYLNYILHPVCWQSGYTHCAAIGEDFFQLYQAGYNFVNGYFVYRESAKEHLIAPYFVIMRYFPITPFIWGIPTLLFSSAMSAYSGYLYLSILLHISSIYFIVKIADRSKAQKYQIISAVFIWLTYFSLTSEWRMGQFNHLAGMFFLMTIWAELYGKNILSAIFWILSLAWKPQALFVTLYFWITKNKFAIGLFTIFFVIFTTIYLGYFQTQGILAFREFFKNILILEDHHGYQVGYIDNFSVNALWGQYFYPISPVLYNIVSKFWSVLVIIILLLISIKFSKKFYNLESSDQVGSPSVAGRGVSGGKIYLLLFTAVSMSVFHKEVWESHLTFWLPTLITLLLITKNKKDWIFVLVCSLMLASPTLFYHYSIYKLEWIKTLMIGLKVIPQLAIYYYLIRKISTKKPV